MPRKFFDFRDIKWPGTWLVENELPAAIPQIPYNRTLIAQQFTDEAPADVEFIQDCQSVNEVFERFKPSKLVEFENEEGVGEEAELNFNALKDFGREGIIEQSDLLNKISDKQQMFGGFMEKLTDEQLNILLANPEEKTAYIDILKSLIEELEAADPSGDEE